MVDRESAYETLAKRADEAAAAALAEEEKIEQASAIEREYKTARRYQGARVGRSNAKSSRATSNRRTKSFGEAMTNAVIKELNGTTGRRLVRGILGGLFKGR
jgi:hypothetical protein